MNRIERSDDRFAINSECNYSELERFLRGERTYFLFPRKYWLLFWILVLCGVGVLWMGGKL